MPPLFNPLQIGVAYLYPLYIMFTETIDKQH